MIEPIKVDGLEKFSRNLRKLDNDLPKALRKAMNDAAQIVVDYAVPRIPRRTGRAARSVRVASTRTAVRVRAGGPRVAYYPWLDFGGRVGRKNSVKRPFLKQGRYLWKGYAVKREQVQRALERALLRIARESGVDVD